MNKRPLNAIAPEPGALSAAEISRLVGKDNPVILEIGANVGQSTLELLKYMPNAKIYCFEPDPRAASIFRSRVTSPNVVLFETAVGNSSGRIVFHQSTGEGQWADWNQSGSIRKPKNHTRVWSEVKFENTIEVPIVRLDDWVMDKNLEVIDFIWADVQGAEIDLCQGAVKTLEKTRYFYTEYSNDEWYEGQVTLQEVYDTLGCFSALRVFPTDALFENLLLKSAAPVVGDRLHIGGKIVKEGWKILNSQDVPGVDFVGDICDLSAFESESFDEIYASHVFEHVPHIKALSTLKGIHRLLRSDGVFYVSVPDLDVLAHTLLYPAASLQMKQHVMMMMFGGQVDAFDYHYSGWNQQLLYVTLQQAGFSSVKRVSSFGIFDDTSNYKPYGFPISLNVIAKK